MDFLLKAQGKTWDGLIDEDMNIADLDRDALQYFRKHAIESKRLTEKESRRSDNDLLDKLGLIKQGQFTKACAILFSKNSEKSVFGAYLKIGMFRGKTGLVFQDEIHVPAIMAPDKAIELLFQKYFKALVSYEGIYRVETFPVEREAVREAILNAVVHRDYMTGSPIAIKVTDSQDVTIYNDGRLPDNWTIDTLLALHKSVPRNPLIAGTFFRSGAIETWGRGVEKMNILCDENNSPRPTFKSIGNDLAITFEYSEKYKDPENHWATSTKDPVKWAGDPINDHVNDHVKLSQTATTVLEIIKKDTSYRL